ncbi:acyl-CoA thioesterase [Vannielia litorea]|uniref:acyl-CoA thioesterase n=1 Tax=Vannielia litorea TaxID=1217970 RepID=UPI001C95C941|nr:thioesterase family protein [Vannielia litorea]MBY6049960.1 acyl-CoA thioesterase [Vannielia litorea]MBY6077374.1 acyl-CoA thioesterase [Vannielia litorea]
MKTPPATRAQYRALTTHDTRWKDMDPYGHLNNVAYYELFDTAVNTWLINEGLLDILHGDQIGVMVESGCRFLSEIRFPAPVTSGIRIAKIGTSSVRWEIALFAGESDEAAAEGFFTHVYVDAETRRPKPLNDRLRAGLETLA